MKNLKNYINEGDNSAEYIYVTDKQGSKHKLNYLSYAIPFFIISENDIVYLGKENTTHGDLFKSVKKQLKEYNIKNYEDISDNALLQGRIWDLSAIGDNFNDDIIIGWWNDMNNEEYQKYSDLIIKKYSEEYDLDIPKSYYGVDYNGDLITITYGGKNNIQQKTKDKKEYDYMCKQIHLASQKEKNVFFAGFKKARAEHFQKERYNHTKSKTAAEFHNKFTKRYDPKSGKMSWGEKIGDSLQMKTINDYVNEAYLIKKHQTKENVIVDPDTDIIINRLINYVNKRPKNASILMIKTMFKDPDRKKLIYDYLDKYLNNCPELLGEETPENIYDFIKND